MLISRYEYGRSSDRNQCRGFIVRYENGSLGLQPIVIASGNLLTMLSPESTSPLFEETQTRSFQIYSQ